jgi:hypothetical protein
VSELADGFSEEPIDGELVPAEGEQLAEVRVLPVQADGQDALPVVARRATLPATVAAAGGGFALGVAAFMLLRVLRRPDAARSMARRKRRLVAKRQGVDIAASRSFLVDVHLLKR